MGRVKEVLAELDNGAEVIVTEWGLTLSGDALEGSYHITVNDLDSVQQMIHYLREMKPFQTLKEITGSHPHLDIPDLTTLPALDAIPAPATPPGGKRR